MNSSTVNHERDRWQWTATRPEGKTGWLGYAALALAIGWVLHWSASGAQMSWGELASGMPQIGDFLSRSVPPDFEILPRLWAPALETIQIAIWGTLLSVILALPLSVIAASNLHSWHWLRRITRQFLNVVRSINELILALVFVSAVGLGPFPGLLALALQSDERVLSSGGSTVRMAHLARIESFVRRHIDNPDLGPDEVAAGCGVSVRYLHELLRDTNQSLGSWIRDQRLAAAREDLGNPRDKRAIGEIAYARGFADQAQFSRAYRARYGITPKEARARE